MKIIFLFLLVCLTITQSFSQNVIIDTSSKKEIIVKSKKSVYKDSKGNEISPEQFMQLNNTGLYEISFLIPKDSQHIVYILEEKKITSLLNTKLKTNKLIDIEGNEILLQEGTVNVIEF